MRTRFIDERLEWRYAYRCAKQRYGWLLDLYPEDVAQTLSLACCEVSGAGYPLFVASMNHMRKLAQSMGYRRSKDESGKRFWLHDEYREDVSR